MFSCCRPGRDLRSASSLQTVDYCSLNPGVTGCYIILSFGLIELDSETLLSLSLLLLVSVWNRPAHHLRGAGRDADGPAGPALPGALHFAHQPHCSAVAQGVAPVLDWKWICGEYQFDMTASRRRTPPKKQDLKNKS